MTPTIESIIPVFRIFNVEKAREFYVSFLGFQEDFAYEDSPAYMQVSLGDFRLHLSEHHGDGCPGGLVRVRVAGLQPYHQELLAKEYDFLRPNIGEAYGDIEMSIRDPFGNTIKFLQESR
ncbi:MAG: glyoxalase/bleomycin resistance/extradiol dioxygenase family protein [Planctomycetaceae bacterium]|nr:glyoxalase/bleomycin resistance/extradiol dioxygenase family protein [Planctomycetaceae bacterium]